MPEQIEKRTNVFWFVGAAFGAIGIRPKDSSMKEFGRMGPRIDILIQYGRCNPVIVLL